MITLKQLLRAFPQDRSGMAVVEFALLAPTFILLVIGSLYVSLLGFAASNLQYAVEAGARCAAINTTVCTSNASTQTYAAARFMQITTDAATFTANASASCGHSVTGSMTFHLNTGLSTLSIPLSSSACF